MALNDMQSEQVGSMISQALKADAPSKVLRNERVSSFRLNLKIHATNMLYDMRSECTIDGEVNMARWQQIVGSVREWDPATISKQTAILARDFPGISEQYRFSGIEYLRSVVGTVPGSFPDFDTFYGQYMRIVFEYPEVRTFEFFSRMHTGDRDAMFFEAFRRSLHTVLDSTKESSRWVQSQVEQPPQPPSVVRSAVSRKSRQGSVAASKAASHAPILPSDSASCMSSVMLASHHNQQSDSQILREIEGPEAAKTASVAQRAPSSRGGPPSVVQQAAPSEAPKSRVASVRGGSVVSAKSRRSVASAGGSKVSRRSASVRNVDLGQAGKGPRPSGSSQVSRASARSTSSKVSNRRRERREEDYQQSVCFFKTSDPIAEEESEVSFRRE